MADLKKIERDENGLIKGYQYFFTPDGNVDWRKMLKPEHLAPNKQKTKETDISKLQDEELLILLPGIQYLAKLRGYMDVSYPVIAANRDFVSLACRITWNPNYEPPSEGKIVTFTATADACSENTNGFGTIHLTTVAENRSFGRCVRRFLGINIVCQDEIKPFDAEEIQPTKIEVGPHKILADKLSEYNVSFGKFKAKLIADGKYQNVDKWTEITDIPRQVVLSLLDLIKEKEAKSRKSDPQ